MNDIVFRAKQEIDTLAKALTNENHIRTPEIRAISARLFQSLQDKSIEEVFSLCGELLEKSWPMEVIAYDWAYRMKKQYSIDTFDQFESWLIRYVRGWGDCDDFCTHAFGELLCQHPELIDRIIPWTSSEDFWMRRAAAVILILPIRRGTYKGINPFQISDILMEDEHDLVRKGYGWMLKVLSEKEPQKVYQYLLDNKAVMPRVSYRYAIEKMDKVMKEELMR